MLGDLFPLAILAGVLVGLIKSKIHPAKIFLAGLMVFVVLDYIKSEQILSNATNSGVITLILLILSANIIEKTKILQHFSSKLLNSTFVSSYIKLATVTTVMSAFLSNTAVVASFVSVLNSSTQTYIKKLFIPLSFMAILGGTFTLVGTSTNLIVNSFWISKGHGNLPFEMFLIIGIPTAILTGIALYFIVKKQTIKGGEVVKQDSFFVEAKVQVGSTLVGKSIQENQLRNLESLFLVELYRNGKLISPVSPSEILEEKDRLIFSGNIDSIGLLDTYDGLELFASTIDNKALKRNLVQALISNRSILCGKTLKDCDFRTKFDAAVVAIKRDGETLSGGLGTIKLQPGDLLVLAIGEGFYKRSNVKKNFFLIDKEVRHKYTLNKKQELYAIGGFLSAICLGVSNIVPFDIGLTTYVFLSVVFGLVSSNDLKRRFPFELWVLITSALSIATVIEATSIQQFSTFIASLDLSHPFIFIALIYLFTLLLTELVTNNAAAAIAFPIAYSVGLILGGDLLLGCVMATVFGASASFIFPHSYQTNLLVFNAGGLSIKDFASVGYKTSLVYSLSVLTMMYIVFA